MVSQVQRAFSHEGNSHFFFIFLPIAFALLLNSISKKGGLPHNTFTKTHLELDMEREK